MWDEKNSSTIESILNSTPVIPYSTVLASSGYPEFGGLPVSRLFDTDNYTGLNPSVTTGADIGLAEYTNANYFARRSANSYTYPRDAVFREYTALDPAGTKKRLYYAKDGDGDTVEHIAAVAYFDHDLKRRDLQPLYDNFIFLDENCYKDYATNLLPRAAGYAFSLMQYFFRGQIEAVNATTTKDTNNNITGMVLKAKNITPDDTVFANNSSHFVVSYSYTDSGQQHFGKSASVLLRDDIPTNNGTSDDTYQYSFTFDPAIPASAAGDEYLLVYRGKLGAEEDAVAARKVDMPPDSILVDIPGTNDSWGLSFYSGSIDPADSWGMSEGNIFTTSLGGKTITRVTVPLALDGYFSRETFKAIGELGEYKVFVEVWKFTPQYVPNQYGVGFADLYVYDTVLGTSSGDVVVGSDGNDYRCIVAHESDSSNKPVTGGNWASYWVSAGTTGQGTTWTTGDFYSEGMRYRCIKSHTASLDTEPGVGVNWTTYWEVTSSSVFNNYCPICCHLDDMVWQHGTSYHGDLYGRSDDVNYASLADTLLYPEDGYDKVDFQFTSPAIIPDNTSVYVAARYSEAKYLGDSDPLMGGTWVGLLMDMNDPCDDALEGYIVYEPWDAIRQFTPCDGSQPDSLYFDFDSAAMTIFGH